MSPVVPQRDIVIYPQPEGYKFVFGRGRREKAHHPHSHDVLRMSQRRMRSIRRWGRGRVAAHSPIEIRMTEDAYINATVVWVQTMIGYADIPGMEGEVVVMPEEAYAYHILAYPLA